MSGRPDDDRNERRSVVREGEAPRRSDTSRRTAPAVSVDAAFDRARVPRVRARRRASRASGLGRTRNEKGFATVGHARRVERSRVRGGRRRTFCIFSSSCSALLSISLVRSRTATTFSSSCHILFACSLSRSAVAEGSSSARAVQSTVLSTTALVRSDFLSRSMCPAASEVTVRPTSRSRLPPAPGLIGSVGSISSVDPPRASRAPLDRARVFFRHLKGGFFSLHIRGSRDTPIPGIFLGGIIRGTNSCSTRSQNSLTPKPSSWTRRSPFCKPSNGLIRAVLTERNLEDEISVLYEQIPWSQIRSRNSPKTRRPVGLISSQPAGSQAVSRVRSRLPATCSCRSRNDRLNDRLGNGSPVRTRAEP